MGRWGYLLFEGDTDLDVESYVMEDIRKEVGGEYASKDDEDPKEIPDEVLRTALDGGLTKKLLKEYQEIDENSPRCGSLIPEYNNVIFAVTVMRVGAKLDDENRKYLRGLAEKTPSRYGYALPLGDDGFRDAGKVQFLASLEHYQNGTPRPLTSSCWNCGKTEFENGKPPATCKQCGHGAYCNKDCQKADWKKHKTICRVKKPNAGGFIWGNV